MIRRLFVSKVLLIFATSYIVRVDSENVDVGIPPPNYPQAVRDENISDKYPGDVIVKDPYRGLEKLDSDETKKFIEAETALGRSYLDKCPFRTELAARYKELFPFASTIAFFQKGKKFFSYQNDGSLSKKQLVVYVQDSPTGEARVLLDPNTLSKDGSVTLNFEYSTVSDDGMIFAYVLGAGDSDWNTIKFKHVEKGDIYKETLTRVKFSLIAFIGDFKGIFYSGYLDYKGKLDGTDNEPPKNHKLYYHKLGTDQSQDIVVAEFLDKPDGILNGFVTGEGKYMTLTQTMTEENGNNFDILYIADLAKIKNEIKGKLDWIPIDTKGQGSYHIILNYDTTFIFLTDANAPNWKLISFDITDVGKTWKDLVQEDKKNKLEFAYGAYEKYMILCYTVDIKNVLQLHDLKTGQLIKKFDLEIGKIDETLFFSDILYKDFYFSLESFTNPGTIYHCDLSKASFDLDVFRETKLKNWHRENFITEQVFFKSKDGTQIPMFLAYKKDLQKNANNPVMMINNSGYGTKIEPTFNTNSMLFIDNLSGIYVLVNNRGGNEYGEEWHQAGTFQNKQNAFDDVHAAAEYLIAEKYTNTKLIGLHGNSQGGLIAAACINQRPDLYRIAYVTRGIFDVLRFDKYPEGDIWIPEIGSPTDPKDFPIIDKYAPMRHITIGDGPEKQYPAIWLDITVQDRISPIHSLKFIATLQFEAKKHPTQKNPLILTFDPTTIEQTEKLTDKAESEKTTAQYVDVYSFFAMNLGMKFQPSCCKDD